MKLKSILLAWLLLLACLAPTAMDAGTTGQPVYQSSTGVLTPPVGAGSIGFTPFGTVGATNVQTAIEEVFNEAAGGSPVAAKYILQTPHGSLPSAQSLNTLASCLLANTTGTGILSCYGGSGAVANQFLRSINGLGVGTHSQVGTADLNFDVATQAELDAHVNDTSAAHAATAISVNPFGTVGATNVQAALEEVFAEALGTGGPGGGAPVDATYVTRVPEAGLSNELALGSLATGLMLNTTATGIPTIYAGATCTNQFARGLGSTGTLTCQGVGVVDLNFDPATQAELDAHVNDTNAAHAASAISTVPAGTLSAADVQAALNELDTEKMPSTDNRLAAMQTPAPLSNPSVITCTKPTQLITGSGGAVQLSDAKWLADGTFAGQSCELENSSTLNTVTGPTTATIINCGGAGSVVIGKNHESPLYVWTGSQWQQKGCLSLQRAANVSKVIDIPGTQLSLRDGTSGFDIKVVAAVPTIEAICATGPCDTINKIATGKKFEVQNNAAAPMLTITESTGAVTNANLNAESTGNTLTIPDYWDLDLVGVVGGVASHIWNDDPTLTACTPLTVAGTNRTTGYCTFPDSDGNFGRSITRYLPTGWTGALDAEIWWKTTGTGNARFQFQTTCVADDEVDDAAFNAASIITAPAGTSGRPNKQTITGITTTGCAAGELMRVRFFRQRTEASDTLTAALDVEKVVFKYRVAH